MYKNRRNMKQQIPNILNPLPEYSRIGIYLKTNYFFFPLQNLILLLLREDTTFCWGLFGGGFTNDGRVLRTWPCITVTHGSGTAAPRHVGLGAALYLCYCLVRAR